jgi:hypothetical protein
VLQAAENIGLLDASRQSRYDDPVGTELWKAFGIDQGVELRPLTLFPAS